MDKYLNFNEHVSHKVAKSNQILGLMKRTFKYIGKDAFIQLYKSSVRPVLE